ncbi:hypothetical protein [Blastopirellula marina]|uniref:Cell division protein FtsH n=1 Tax=Blastopirellula marina TaxID=124 RepID=A0A2S8FNS5_9BACT|nr:hypothetical protein [Blastopirellula marina]PQO33839.1 hypothetical protein C5Y98_16560 [Blastopirellula marina]PTL43626.1 hypothetical protein C5Y97_16570 [Blastopirellula marina]
MEEINAYHEAGHALVAILVGARVRHVTLEPDKDDGPDRFAEIQVEWPLDRFPRRQIDEKMVLVSLAGPVAEMIHTGEPYHPGYLAEWAADWQAAWNAAATLAPHEQKRMVYLEQATRSLYQLLDQDRQWAALAAIVDNLLAHETLAGEEVEDIVQSWL